MVVAYGMTIPLMSSMMIFDSVFTKTYITTPNFRSMAELIYQLSLLVRDSFLRRVNNVRN